MPFAGIGRAIGAAPRGLPILAFHRLAPSTVGPTTETVWVFEAQLDWLEAQGYRIVALREAAAALPHLDTTAKLAAISFDDGHRSAYDYLLPVIRRRRMPVTLFIYPSAISNASYALTWPELAELHASGDTDVQSHTYWHPDFRVERRRLAPARFRAFVEDQLRRSKTIIEQRIGGTVDMLAWPFGIIDTELKEIARSVGYRFAFGYGGGPAEPSSDPLALPRIPIGNSDRGAQLERRVDAQERRAK